MKKSFILHLDSLDLLDELSIEDCGLLFKAMRDYNISKTQTLTGTMKALFIQFKNQFDRDNEKYENSVERNKINGLSGGRPKNPNGLSKTQRNPNKPSGFSENPKKPYNDNDSVNDNDSDNKKEKEIKKTFIAPTLLEVLNYFKENGYSDVSAKKAFEYYETGQWKDSKGNKVKNWKQKMQGVWFKDENKVYVSESNNNLNTKPQPSDFYSPMAYEEELKKWEAKQ